jgi:hypothetical protein
MSGRLTAPTDARAPLRLCRVEIRKQTECVVASHEGWAGLRGVEPAYDRSNKATQIVAAVDSENPQMKQSALLVSQTTELQEAVQIDVSFPPHSRRRT